MDDCIPIVMKWMQSEVKTFKLNCSNFLQERAEVPKEWGADRDNKMFPIH